MGAPVSAQAARGRSLPAGVVSAAYANPNSGLSPFTTPDYYTYTDDVVIEGNQSGQPHRDAGGNDERIPVRRAESRLEVLGSVYATPVRDHGVPDTPQSTDVVKRSRRRVAEWLQFSAGPKILAGDPPQKNAVLDRLNQRRSDCPFGRYTRVTSVEQNVRVDGVQAVGLG